MARTTLTFHHSRASDLKTKATDAAPLTLQKLAQFLSGLAGHVYDGTSFTVGQTAATGTVTLSGVGGTAAIGTFTYSSASGTTVATLAGVAFTQTTGSDAARATALSAAINASVDPAISGLLTASPASGVVTVTAVHKGTAANAYTLAVTGTGLARSAATMAGGAAGSVTVTVNGTAVPTTTTDQTDAEAATAVAASLNADATAGLYVEASASGAVVTVEALTADEAGNVYTLSSTSSTGTATASGSTLAGGAADSYTL